MESIIVDGVSKRFRLRHAHSIKEMTVRALRRQSLSEPFTALDDISLTVEQGEAVALMGLNGSGKSTLLKLISGVMQPDGGRVRVRGRVAGLIEVGAGLHPDLTGRENIFLNAAILGMNRKQTLREFDSIVEFSGIEKFLDTQVKFYSSGMFMRLGFSVAVHTDPDIFLVDEALAVGDAPFQKKCLARIKELHAEGRTLVIVSHEMSTLRKVCDRGVVLRTGKLVHDGDINSAILEVTGRPKAVPPTRRGKPTTATRYLVGSSGYPNYGDELIAASWLRHLAETAPDSEVWLDCPHPGTAAALLGHLHPRVRFTDTFWRLCWEAPSDDPRVAAEFARDAIANFESTAYQRDGRLPSGTSRWAAGYETAVRADVVHLIGGGYVNGLWPRHYGLLGAATAAAERGGGKAVMTGQGLVPGPEGEPELLRELAGGFELIDVRDRPSAEALGDGLPVMVTGDDALLDHGPHVYQEAVPPEVMVCLQSDLLDGSVEELAAFLRETLAAWDVSAKDLGVVEGIPGIDRQVPGLLKSELAGARFYSSDEILQRGLPAAEGQTWISSRFHMHLMAAATGASGVAVSVNERYYANKHQSLIDQGSGWTLLDGLGPVTRPTGGGFAAEVVEEAREAKAELAAKIYS